MNDNWTKHKVKELIVHHMSGPSPTCEERKMANSREWGILKTTAVVWQGWNPEAHKVPPETYWNNKTIQVKKGDVLITKAGPRNRVGVVVYVDETPPNLMVSGKMVGLRPKSELVDCKVLAGVLSSEKTQRYLNSRTTGMAESQLNFTNEFLLNTVVSIPPIDEQRKISGLISLIDNQINANQALIKKYQKIKDGITFDLFTCGIDADGKLRPSPEQAPELYYDTKIGLIPKDWRAVELGELYSEPSRNGLYKPAQFHGRGPLMIQMGDMFKGMNVSFSGASRVEVTEEEYRIFGLKKGDLLFGRRSLVMEGAGKCTLVEGLPEKSTFESSIIRVRVNLELLIPKYAAFYFSSEIAYLERRKFIRQVAVSGVSGQDVKQFPIPLPSYEEQKRIIERIQSIDTKLENHKAELKKYRMLKSGLMHDLFTDKIEYVNV
jgi:type I restriction enzyme S subunit